MLAPHGAALRVRAWLHGGSEGAAGQGSRREQHRGRPRQHARADRVRARRLGDGAADRGRGREPGGVPRHRVHAEAHREPRPQARRLPRVQRLHRQRRQAHGVVPGRRRLSQRGCGRADSGPGRRRSGRHADLGPRHAPDPRGRGGPAGVREAAPRPRRQHRGQDEARPDCDAPRRAARARAGGGVPARGRRDLGCQRIPGAWSRRIDSEDAGGSGDGERAREGGAALGGAPQDAPEARGSPSASASSICLRTNKPSGLGVGVRRIRCGNLNWLYKRCFK
mmetsp:Transcript_60460/g.142637  ORF Transcript_60460/g.142637 Transcript_60460/m.142637 type:complete len:280 (+) Transcript_60460:1972-2811(+)